MSMIEGIGDEVVQFFSAVIIVGVALLAWWSTNITEGPLIRTVLILERRSRNRTATEVVAPQPSVTENENGIDTGQDDVTEEILETEAVDLSTDKDESETVVVGTTTEAAPVSDCNDTEISDSASNSQSRNSSSTVSESNVINRNVKQTAPKKEDVITPEVSMESVIQETVETADQIRIRLKYLNDDQKLVDGRLQEPLGDFKR